MRITGIRRLLSAAMLSASFVSAGLSSVEAAMGEAAAGAEATTAAVTSYTRKLGWKTVHLPPVGAPCTTCELKRVVPYKETKAFKAGIWVNVRLVYRSRADATKLFVELLSLETGSYNQVGCVHMYNLPASNGAVKIFNSRFHCAYEANPQTGERLWADIAFADVVPSGTLDFDISTLDLQLDFTNTAIVDPGKRR